MKTWNALCFTHPARRGRWKKKFKARCTLSSRSERLTQIQLSSTASRQTSTLRNSSRCSLKTLKPTGKTCWNRAQGSSQSMTNQTPSRQSITTDNFHRPSWTSFDRWSVATTKVWRRKFKRSTEASAQVSTCRGRTRMKKSTSQSPNTKVSSVRTSWLF